MTSGAATPGGAASRLVVGPDVGVFGLVVVLGVLRRDDGGLDEDLLLRACRLVVVVRSDGHLHGGDTLIPRLVRGGGLEGTGRVVNHLLDGVHPAVVAGDD